MIQFFRIVALVVLAAFLVMLCLVNRDIVSFRLFPQVIGDILGFQGAYLVPQYLIVFGAVVVGLIAGAIREYFRGHRYRRQASERGREIRRLEREVEDLKSRSGEVRGKDEVLELLEKDGR